MKLNDIRQLKAGDEVFWNDPDDGACSRIYVIKTIWFFGHNQIRIEDEDGCVLECPSSELVKID